MAVAAEACVHAAFEHVVEHEVEGGELAQVVANDGVGLRPAKISATRSPDTVRRFIAAEIAANDCNYFVPQLVFGSMTLAEALRAIELFSKEIMPAFAE